MAAIALLSKQVELKGYLRYNQHYTPGVEEDIL
jgi:hypothetical protein